MSTTTDAALAAAAAASTGWRTVSFFDACHTPFRGAGDDLARLCSELDLVAGTPVAAHGFVVLADASGNLHVASSAMPRAGGGGGGGVSSSVSVESFPAVDDGMRITAVTVVADPRVAMRVHTKHEAAAVTLLVAAQEPDGAPLIRVVRYDPTATTSQSLDTIHAPFTIVRDLRMPASLTAASALRRLSLTSTATSGSNPALHPLGYVTHVAQSLPPAAPAILVGFSSGALVLLRGDVLRERPAGKPVVLREENNADPVTGLAFAGSCFFVTTAGAVYCVTPRDQLVALDAEAGAVVPPVPFPKGGGSQVLVVQHQTLVVFCAESGRGQAYAVGDDGASAIRSIAWLNLAPEISGAPSPYLAVIATDEVLQRDTLAVYHLEHRLCVHVARFAHVRCVAAAAGANLLVLADTGLASEETVAVARLKEKPLAMRLDELVQEHLFTTAIALAGPSAGAVAADLHGAYADHLLAQGDTSGALREYEATIGRWETSRVVRKLSSRPDAQPMLVAYLQTLHERGVATADHTQLLFHALIRAGDHAALADLVRGNAELPFDVEVAIRCCVAGGLWDVALDLATRHAQHDLRLQILVHRTHDADAALAFLGSSEMAGDPATRLALVRQFGRALIAARPGAATELLKTVVAAAADAGTLDLAQVTALARLYPPQQSSQLHAFYRFVLFDHPGARAVVAADAGVWNAAFDSCPDADAAMAVLKHPDSRVAADRALMTARARYWVHATLYLHARRGDARAMIDVHMELTGNVAEMVRIVREHGSAEDAPALWTAVLAYTAGTDPVRESDLRDVMAHIDAAKALTPVQVLGVLARNPAIRFGLVRGVFAAHMDAARAVVAENESLAATYAGETQRMHGEIEALEAKPVTFQVTACAACNTPLALPTAHFFCRHSFHVRCLNEASSAKQCPKCFREHRRVAALKKTLAAKAGEDFYAQLQHADDGFGVVSDWFSRKDIR
ncbi:hypothetical protein H9P43_006699 [Blastocladiella emersonii ATCC 22665]|nr:hypothetical protein H9P43_006699 [Blastocladiella emersonii ATCC 22665]